jgi:ABC-type polysaccharide/polyol phosphate export permease
MFSQLICTSSSRQICETWFIIVCIPTLLLALYYTFVISITCAAITVYYIVYIKLYSLVKDACDILDEMDGHMARMAEIRNAR